MGVSMQWVEDIKERAGGVIGPVIGICVAGYFAVHAVQGERGVKAWIDLQRKVELTRVESSRISAEKTELEKRVALLRPDSLDPDMLEERARLMLNFGRKDEMVIMDHR